MYYMYVIFRTLKKYNLENKYFLARRGRSHGCFIKKNAIFKTNVNWLSNIFGLDETPSYSASHPDTHCYHTVLVLINLGFRCGSVAVAVNWLFVFISSFFAMFKNVAHSLEPCETPSNSASHKAPSYVQSS